MRERDRMHPFRFRHILCLGNSHRVGWLIPAIVPVACVRIWERIGWRHSILAIKEVRDIIVIAVLSNLLVVRDPTRIKHKRSGHRRTIQMTEVPNFLA
jgi:hypothetical protein